MNMEYWSMSCSCCLAFARAAWPHLVPPLVVMALEGPQSLKTWLAVQDTPAEGNNSAFAELSSGSESRAGKLFRVVEKVSLTHIAPAYLLAVSIFSVYAQAALPGYYSSFEMTVYHALALGPLFAYATWRCFAIFSGLYILGVRRDADGGENPCLPAVPLPALIINIDPRIVFVPRSSRDPLWDALPVLGALGVAYGSIICDDTICTVIAHITLLQTLVSADTVTRKSFRGMVPYVLTNVATLFVLALVLFFPLSPAYIAFSSVPALLGSVAAPNAETHYLLFALSILWNIFPTEFATLCFRADFARHASQEAYAPMLPQIEKDGRYEDTVGPIYLPGEDSLRVYSAFVGTAPPLYMGPAQESNSAPTSVPRRLPPFFPLPFFLTALSAHLITCLALLSLAYLGALSAIPLLNMTEAGSGAAALAHVGPLLPLASLPVTVLAVLGAAAVRRGGVAWRLWRYTEVWSASTSASACTCRACRGVKTAAKPGLGC